MTVLNALLVRVADAVLTPLSALPPWLAIVMAALVTAVAVLWLVRLTSNQTALAAVKQQIQADLFEMRLFNDDLRGLLRAQGQVLRHNGTYLRLSFLPLLVTAVPLGLAIAQLQAWYGYDGLTLGQPVVLSADLRSGVPPAGPQLTGLGFTTDRPAFYFPSRRQVVWRLVPDTTGTHLVTLAINGERVEKTVVVGHAVARRSPARVDTGIVDQFLEPSEPPLSGGGVSRVTVAYPERSIEVLGLSMHWLVIYLLASFAFVLLLRRPLGVVI